MRITDMTEAQYKTFCEGWANGEQDAIDCCFNCKVETPYFGTPEDEELYSQGYRRGYGTID